MQILFGRSYASRVMFRGKSRRGRKYSIVVAVAAFVFFIGIAFNVTIEFKFRGRRYHVSTYRESNIFQHDSMSEQARIKKSEVHPNQMSDTHSSMLDSSNRITERKNVFPVETVKGQDGYKVMHEALPLPEKDRENRIIVVNEGKGKMSVGVTKTNIRNKTPMPLVAKKSTQSLQKTTIKTQAKIMVRTTLRAIYFTQTKTNKANVNKKEPQENKPVMAISTAAQKQQTVHGISNIKTKATTPKETLASEQNPYKTVLLFTTLFDQPRWVDLSDQQIVDYPQRAKCPHANTCKLTYDKSAIDYASAVIFHGVDLMNNPDYSLSKLLPYIKRRPFYQRWIFFMHESPANYDKFQDYKFLFNWTMTYEYRSDIFLPYNHYRALTKKEKASLPPPKDVAKGKDKLVIWMVSNCGKFREKYIKKLQKIVKISIYGKCRETLGSKLPDCKKDTPECNQIVRSHKFLLAFENTFCEDYISEKFWGSLTNFDIVPVVFGANYDPRVVPPGSYIDTANFSSVQALADYLIYLDKNDTAYNEYFSWKKKYTIASSDKICRICELIHNPTLPSKVYKDVWSYKKSCLQYEAKKKKYETIINN